MATAKTTTRKPTVTAKEPVGTAAKEIPIPEEVLNEKDASPVNSPTPKKAKKFERDEFIPCRSITAGLLLWEGPKTKTLYRWSSLNDVTYVEYQDLFAGMNSRSAYIYEPLFIIEDPEVFEDFRWKDIEKVYDTLYDSEDLRAILELPLRKFKEVFPTLPKGAKVTLCSEVSTQLQAGEFDSIAKLRIIDEVCGTDLHSLM